MYRVSYWNKMIDIIMHNTFLPNNWISHDFPSSSLHVWCIDEIVRIFIRDHANIRFILKVETNDILNRLGDEKSREEARRRDKIWISVA